jgi:thioredoxin reductase (NADPH)
VNKPALLVVDDDPQVLAAIRRDLRSKYRENYTVLSAESGQQALDTIRELKARGESLAMIVSDQRMPGMLGNEVLAQSLEIYPVARRVLLTAYADTDAAVRAINQAHVHHYLPKPWAPPEENLYPVLDDLLDDWQVEYLPEKSGLRVVGHQWSPQSHAIKNFLASSLVPYHWLDVERDGEARTLLDSRELSLDRLPVVFFEDGSAMPSPEPRQLAERLGRSLAVSGEVYDLVIVGAGPTGLAAAVYGASEGLKTLILDRQGPGGQAGASSKIENYLGFPNGVSGGELTSRALRQAERLGAEVLFPLEAAAVSIDSGYKHLTLADRRHLVARTLLAATGMVYRELPAAGVGEFTGAGVYYGTVKTEAPAFRDRRVFVVGGGNSAGQAAMYLARYAKEVHIVVRRSDLHETMSRYLIDAIRNNPKIQVRGRMEIDRVEGNGHVERLGLRSMDDGSSATEAADALFVFIGTRPQSDWLPSEVLRDPRGCVLTGRDLMAAEPYARMWKESREPLTLETSVPGVFAAGDVRAGAIHRVASAVGEGAMMVRLAHEYLAMT